MRAVALALVVVGHWTVAAIEVRGGQLRGANLLAVQPGIQVATWLFQVVPLFFVVGGFAHAGSWARARHRGLGYGGWLLGRVDRLVRPTLVLAVVWALGSVIALAGGADPALVRLAGRLVGFPLWFLAVYLPVVALAPAMVALNHRVGLAAPVALAAAVGLVDWAHWGLGLPVVGWANFLLVFLFAHQLGLCWWNVRHRDASQEHHQTGGVLLGLGLAGMVLLTGVAGYPLSMVGVAGAARNNNDPASLALVALATAQMGAVVLVRPVVVRWLGRPGVARALARASRVSMTVFLWHFPALILTALLLLGTGAMPGAPIGSLAWWAWRPPWLGLIAVVLTALVVLFARYEQRPARPGSPAPSASPPPGRLSTGLAAAVAVVAAVVATTGALVLTLGGMVDPSTALGPPVIGVGLLVLTAIVTGSARRRGIRVRCLTPSVGSAP